MQGVVGVSLPEVDWMEVERGVAEGVDHDDLVEVDGLEDVRVVIEDESVLPFVHFLPDLLAMHFLPLPLLLLLLTVLSTQSLHHLGLVVFYLQILLHHQTTLTLLPLMNHFQSNHQCLITC